MTTIAVKVLDERMADQLPAYATAGSAGLDLREIGRASCRERVYSSV